jgi:hypothetical protein
MRSSLLRLSSTLHKKIDAANAEALARMAKANIVLEDLRPARELIPALADPNRKLVLISGPPVTWKNMGNAQKGAVAGICIFEAKWEEKNCMSVNSWNRDGRRHLRKLSLSVSLGRWSLSPTITMEGSLLFFEMGLQTCE